MPLITLCVRLSYGYEVELSGKELLEKIYLDEKYTADIQPDHHYIITAYDW